MKKRMFITTGVGIAMLICVLTGGVYAWNGDTWSSINRSTIESSATAMINYFWTPKNTINNFEYGSTYYPFYNSVTNTPKGQVTPPYAGVAYSQNNPQENLSEFQNLVSNTNGGTTNYGNDCSGFVSICWKLPSRYTTTTFESDAIAEGGNVSCLGDIINGSTDRINRAKSTLLIGDAFVESGNHIVLFQQKTTSGIKTMEQTPYSARYKDWTWSQLNTYRPIRRNSVNEDAPPYFSCPEPTLAKKVKLGSKINFTGTAKDDKGLSVVTMLVSGPSGSNKTAFTDNVSGTIKSLSGYSFDSKNPDYANVTGSYTVALWIKDTNQKSASITFTVSVGEGDVPPTPKCPSGNGDYCGSTSIVGQNTGYLYACSNGNYTLKTSCSNGCQVNSGGTNDVCKVPAKTCPSGNGDYCGSSSIPGQNTGYLYACSNGTYTLKTSCAKGCQVNSGATNDVCKVPEKTCPSGNGDYCGSSSIAGQNTNYLYKCSNGDYTVKTKCSNGCKVNSGGTNDVCKVPAKTCPSGNGDYCGSSSIAGQNTSYLYKCSSGDYTVKTKCSNGCKVNSGGTNDVCKAATTCPSGNGDYCGSSSLGQKTNYLYSCSNGTYKEKKKCSKGCKVNSSGKNDVCK